MAEIIAFPRLPAPYAERTADLGKAECVLLIAIRWWVAAYKDDADPLPRLRDAMETAGTADAAFSIDGLMTVASRTVRRQLDIRCPRCPNISGDENRLLHAARLTQDGDRGQAEKVLRTTLLSTQGAEFMMPPLEGLVALFTRARLVFRRADATEPHIPGVQRETIH